MEKNMIRFIGFYNYTVILTYISLISSVLGITEAFHEDYKTAILCLAISGICDAFDGRVARRKKNRTEDEKDFGIQLDSLVDVICFGVFPALICYLLGVRGWLGLIIAAGIFALLLEPRLLMLAPFALVALYFVMPEAVVNRLLSVGDLTDTSTSYRVAIWMGSIAMLKDYWLCGVGPGTAAFNLVYPAYSYNAANAQHAHNLYLQLLIDGGVCLLLLFLVVMFVLYRRSCACLAREKGARRIHLIAILSGITGFLAQSMTDYSFYNYRVMLAFWATVGLGACWLKGKKEGDK